MKRLVLVALTVGMLAATAPLSAHADGSTFKGGCSFATLNDTTPGGQLGGQDVWSGVVRVAVVGIDSASGLPNPGPISARCDLRVNGVSQGEVLRASGPAGFAFNANSIQFTASATDVVSMCIIVETTEGTVVVCVDPGGSINLNCVTVSNSGTCKSGVCVLNSGTCDGGICVSNSGTCSGICVLNSSRCGSGCIAGENDGTCGNGCVAVINSGSCVPTLLLLDDVACPIFASHAGTYGPVIMNGEGDVYLLTTDQFNKWYDCPPYDPST